MIPIPPVPTANVTVPLVRLDRNEHKRDLRLMRNTSRKPHIGPLSEPQRHMLNFLNPKLLNIPEDLELQGETLKPDAVNLRPKTLLFNLRP